MDLWRSMNAMVILDVFFRWLHVTAACLAVGGAFFIRVLLPIAMQNLEPPAREAFFLRHAGRSR